MTSSSAVISGWARFSQGSCSVIQLHNSILGQEINTVRGLGATAKANYKFVTSTKKEPRSDQTKSYKVKCRANTRGENKGDSPIKTTA
jgi:hypothetical protein